MHGNKLHFYLSGAKELRDFFASFLEDKLIELNKIVAAAERNIQRYNEVVRISNNNLTKAWLDQLGLINLARTRTTERLKRLDALPSDYSSFGSVVKMRLEISNDLSRDAKFRAGSLSARLHSAILPQLQEHFREAESAIADANLEELTTTSHGITSVQVTCDLAEGDPASTRLLVRKYDDLDSTQADALQESLVDLKRAMRDIDELLQQQAPFAEFEAIIDAAQKSLTADVNQFFQNVELYRGGVFSHTTKESIATLGIGRRLDELEEEFNDDDKASFAAVAVSDLFPGFTELKAKALTSLATLSSRVRPILESLRAVKIERPADGYRVEGDASDAQSNFHDELIRAGPTRR